MGGNSTGHKVTVIDTPGFGATLVKEEKMIETMVNVLKEEVKNENVFVNVFKQDDTFNEKHAIFDGEIFGKNSAPHSKFCQKVKP